LFYSWSSTCFTLFFPAPRLMSEKWNSSSPAYLNAEA
jgi:hypothetical protein